MWFLESVRVDLEVESVFYNMLDFAAIITFVLYLSCMCDNVPRRDFMLQLALELHAVWLALRVSLTHTGTEERMRMTCMVKAQCKHFLSIGLQNLNKSCFPILMYKIVNCLRWRYTGSQVIIKQTHLMTWDIPLWTKCLNTMTEYFFFY